MGASQAQFRQLKTIIEGDAWLMEALRSVHRALPEGYIGAGVIRDVVWDRLQGYREFQGCSDVDVAYFDPSDLRSERDHEIERSLSGLMPGAPWEVTNQAGVHLWFAECFGHAVDPLTSIEDAVSSWPELATSVAVRWKPGTGLETVAPLGLDDLLSMVVRRNPRRVSLQTYLQRLDRKRYRERWPKVTIIPA